MISFRAIQGSFTLTRHGLFQPRGLSNKKNLMVLSVSKSSDSNSEDSQSQPPEGDARKQELLARIAMLQTQKVRLTDYLDERSAYLTQFAEEANAEFDQIGEDALKGLDEASARIMENIESRMQAFEESAESNKVEIEKNEKMLAEFEGQIEKDRNEGLFFKNLRETKPVEKAKAKEIEKIRELTVDSAGSRTRRNIYLVLIGLIAVGIVDSLLSPSAGWQKVAVLGIILVGLVSQLFFEQRLIAETERIEKQKGEHEKE